MQVVAAWLQNDDTHSWRLQQRMMCRRYMHLLRRIGNRYAQASVRGVFLVDFPRTTSAVVDRRHEYRLFTESPLRHSLKWRRLPGRPPPTPPGTPSFEQCDRLCRCQVGLRRKPLTSCCLCLHTPRGEDPILPVRVQYTSERLMFDTSI